MKTQQEKEEEIFECSACNNKVDTEDEFCPECGTLFEDGVSCSVHSDIEA